MKKSNCNIGALLSREQMKNTAGGDVCLPRVCVGRDNLGFYAQGWCQSDCMTCLGEHNMELTQHSGCLPDES